MAWTKKSLIGVAALSLATFANAQSMTFDTPVTTGNSQAAGTWYTDRYNPAGFTSPVNFMGDNRLKESISAADSELNRPTPYNTPFYNYQGRKYDLFANTTSVSVDMYVAADWTTTIPRGGSLWGTGVDNLSLTTAYPIIEFASEGGTGRFRGWDNGSGWVDMGLPTGFAADQFYTMKIDLVGGNFVYSVGDLTMTSSAFGSTSIANAMLQGHNDLGGETYDIYWDNLQAVPEPSSIAAVGLGVLAFARRRRKKS